MISPIAFSNPFDAFESDDHLEWNALPVDSVELSPEQMAEAARHAAAIAPTQATPVADSHDDGCWRTYLMVLATTGLATWLGDRASDLSTDLTSILDGDRLQQALYSTSDANALTPIQVGEFRVCVLAMGSLTDEAVSLPAAVLSQGEAIAHFYVLVEVLEEQHQARIHGYLRYDQWQQGQLQLSQSRQSASDDLTQDETYTIPLTHFTPNADDLLLDLRALNPAAIPLPTATAMTAPATPEASRLERLVEQIQSVADGALNAAAWMQDQLDQVAADLSWSLMPELVPVTTGLRSGAIANGDFATEDALAEVFNDLQTTGLEMPLSVRGAYRDLRWGKAAVRLHALVWDMPESELGEAEVPEWALLLVLSALPGHTLPAGLTLVVRDEHDILAERGVVGDDDDGSLYAQVIGAQDEMFWVTIDFGNGAIATLPPFAFQPQS